MKKPKEIDADDLALFREYVKNVKPLQHDKVAPYKAKRRIKKIVDLHLVDDEEDKLSDHLKVTVTGEEVLSFACAGLQPKTICELRQGKIKLQAALDLHGMTVPVARKALTQFLTRSQENALYCVLIIHGKGKLTMQAPILKNQVNNWLRQHESVLAFHSAKPQHGGKGAVYVLLKK